MAFQFQCPQGHLLEGDESQAGQTCQCPMCGMAFIIPAPLAAPEPSWSPAAAQPQNPEPAIPQFGPGAPAVVPDVEQAPPLLHIPCPKGHELEVPPEMLNEDVMCPHCGEQFRLKEKDSVEYKRKRQEEEERRIARAGKLWFNWAIVIAVGVVLFLVFLIAVSGGK